jgi:signal transduction histidine kinase
VKKRYLAYFKSWPLIVALGVAIALVATINLLWWELNQQEEQEFVWVGHAANVNSTLTELMLRANEIEVGQRVYAITREPEFLGPYASATNSLPMLLARLSSLTQEVPEERTNLDLLRNQVAYHLQLNAAHLATLMTGNPYARDEAFRAKTRDSLASINALQRTLGAQANHQLNEQRDRFMSTVQTVILSNMVGGVAGVALIAAAVAALYGENKRRRAVEAALLLSHKELENRVQQRTTALREQQARLQLAQSAAHLGIFDWNFQSNHIYRTPELAAMHGVNVGFLRRSPDEWLELVHPDDRPVLTNWIRETRETGRPTEGEWRVIWPDGSVHWLFGRWQAFLDEDGRAISMIGVNLDVTDRKRLEQELVEAGDNEMRRIGHDLHDDVGQQVTALTFILAALKADAARQSLPFADQLKKVEADLRDVLHKIRLLSHGLAPVPIRAGGLADALQQLAADTAASARLECEFCSDQPLPLQDPQQSAQVFRIAQEAVNNALKHSGASQIHIVLQKIGGGWQLVVSDNGRGFRDQGVLTPGSGLGLRAMRHRAGLMGAKLTIESRPGGGTRVICAAQR